MRAFYDDWERSGHDFRITPLASGGGAGGGAGAGTSTGGMREYRARITFTMELPPDHKDLAHHRIPITLGASEWACGAVNKVTGEFPVEFITSAIVPRVVKEIDRVVENFSDAAQHASRAHTQKLSECIPRARGESLLMGQSQSQSQSHSVMTQSAM
jgi:hypothetical protein